MSHRISRHPNLLIGIAASAVGLPPLLEIIDQLSVSYQAAIFVAMHRPPDPTHTRKVDA
jgi:chemotaxis response regulator CheB